MVDRNAAATKDFEHAQARVWDKYGIEAEDRWVPVPVISGNAHVIVVGNTAAGEGLPVVFLNGIGTPAAMFAPLMAEVAEVSNVTQYAIDLPAFGLTDTTGHFAEDLRTNAGQFVVETLDALGLERPVVIANSLGSLIASWVAIDRPDRVAALAHIGCPAVVLGTSAPLPMRLLSTRLGPLMMKLQPPSPRQVKGLSKMVNEYPLPAEIADLILATERLDHFEHTFLTILRRLVRARGNRPDTALTAEQLTKIEVPTMLVFGANDPMGAASVGRAVAAAMQHADLHVVDGGHAPWIHHADQIGPLLTRFLAASAV